MNKFAYTTLLAGAAALALGACAHPEAKPAPPADPPAQTVLPAQAKAEPAPAPAPAPPPAPKIDAAMRRKAVKLYAVVQSVDAAGGTLVVKDLQGRTRKLAAAADAAFTRGGNDESIGFSDVKEGDHVRLKVAGEVALAVHVSVRPAAAR